MGKVYIRLPEGSKMDCRSGRWHSWGFFFTEITITSGDYLVFHKVLTHSRPDAGIKVGLNKRGCFLQHSLLKSSDIRGRMSCPPLPYTRSADRLKRFTHG